MILFEVTTKTGLHALQLNSTRSVFGPSPICQGSVPTLLQFRQFRPFRTRKQKHLFLPDVISYIPNYPLGINYANVCLCDVVWCHKLTEFKAGTLARCSDSDCADFKYILHAQNIYKLHKERKKKEIKEHDTCTLQHWNVVSQESFYSRVSTIPEYELEN